MIRVLDFRIEGSDEAVKLAPLLEIDVEIYIETAKDMVKRKAELSIGDWIAFRNKTISDSMAAVAKEMERRGQTPPPVIAPDELKKHFDPVVIEAMLSFVLKNSRVLQTDEVAGEPKAASTSELSKVA